MSDDQTLSTRLRDGLVTRFVEHPSRLLGDKAESNISITGDGVSKVISASHTAGGNADQPHAKADFSLSLPSEFIEGTDGKGTAG